MDEPLDLGVIPVNGTGVEQGAAPVDGASAEQGGAGIGRRLEQ
jgi:hypothetical protein